MLKILAGEYRSRVLTTPPDDSISRPYGSRVKESLFNLLRGWFDGTTVVDLFAGVGTMGLEAVSRGAARALLVERNAEVFRLLKRNIETLRCGDRVTAVHADAFGSAWIAQAPRPADIIFIDPPYSLVDDDSSRRRVLDLLARCRPLMGERGFVVLRSPVGPQEADFAVKQFHGPEEHRYGKDMRVLLYAPAAPDNSASP